MRSDSCAASVAALEVRIAWPRMSVDSSTMNGGSGCPPLRRVMAPDAQASSTAMRTSAGSWSSRSRRLRYE